MGGRRETNGEDGMSDASVLFVKPQAISDRDKRRLERNGIVVVEIEDPDAVKLVKAGYELSHSDLLAAAARALKPNNSSSHHTLIFGDAVAEMILQSHASRQRKEATP
jgi:hypothetical protein